MMYLTLVPALQDGIEMTRGQKGKTVMEPEVQKPVLTFLVYWFNTPLTHGDI